MNQLSHEWITPEPLANGSKVAIVAPSGAVNPEAFQAGLQRLKSRYDVHVRDDILSRKGYLAGDDSRRQREFVDALNDSSYKAIICARGGYGAMRIVEHVDISTVRRQSKLLVGFSDITALHAAWARARVCSVHASMIEALGRATPTLAERWFCRLEGQPPAPASALQTITKGLASGRLLGGNLALLAGLAGTPYEPPLDNAILFIEDIWEKPYRIDRLLTSLRLHGWWKRVGGIVLGQFTECEIGDDGVTPEMVLREHFENVTIPVVMNFPAGHVDNNLELPFGHVITVNANHGVVTFEKST